MNIARGGEWIGTRLPTSGPRTNPWWRESSDRIVRPGELVSYDTDLIGPFGYGADLSRTRFCGPGRPNGEQRRLYRMAWDQIHRNIDLIGPGLGFREFAERSWPIPGKCGPRSYPSPTHGVGLVNEHPVVAVAGAFGAAGNEGPFLPGMTMCVESYIGETGGYEGVKLERQVLVTETGCEILDTFPFDEDLMFREVRASMAFPSLTESPWLACRSRQAAPWPAPAPARRFSRWRAAPAPAAPSLRPPCSGGRPG